MMKLFFDTDKISNELLKTVEVGIKDIVKRMAPKKTKVEWLNRKAAAKHLDISTRTLHTWTVQENSKLKSYKLNGSIYYKLHELDAAIEPQDFDNFNHDA